MADHNADTQDARAATTDEQEFEVTALYGSSYRKRHLFRADEDTALCGHPSTASHDRDPIEGDHLTQQSVYCESCRQSVLSDRFDYVSTDDIWNALAGLEKHDVVRVEFADADPVEGVVTSPDDGESATKRVSFTADYWTFSPHRDDDTHLALYHAEGEQTTFRRGLIKAEQEERDVTNIEVVRQLDPTERDDPAERREVREQCEQWAADLYRRREEVRDDDYLASLRLFNAAVRLGDAASNLRDGAPLTHVEQKWRTKAARFVDESPRDRDDPEDAAKRRGTHAGAFAVVAVLDAVLGDEDDEGGEDDEADTDAESAEGEDDAAASCDHTSESATDGGRVMTDGGEDERAPGCDCPLESETPDNAARCGEVRTRGLHLTCTRPADHDGPHAACSVTEHPAETWPRDEGAG